MLPLFNVWDGYFFRLFLCLFCISNTVFLVFLHVSPSCDWVYVVENYGALFLWLLQKYDTNLAIFILFDRNMFHGRLNMITKSGAYLIKSAESALLTCLQK